MAPTRESDVLILGSGAGGGPLALDLAHAGLDVVVLEKGPRLSREDYHHDELEVLERGAFLPPLDQEPHTVTTARTQKPVRTQLGWIATCVGGGTVHMGGYLYRFHPDDFRMQSRFGPHLELADWPFGYADLEPFYSRAEWEIGVAGAAAAEPVFGGRSRDYPLPPLDDHPIAAELDAACRARGLAPFPTPRCIASRPYQGRPVCEYCPHCAGYGCPVGAKGSVQEALLPRAEKTGRCEVLPHSMAKEILLGRDDRAVGCVYVDARGQEHEARAKVVCVSCSAIESARLLLLSRSPLHPDGLGNRHGLVGRHLQFHATTTGQARFRLARHAAHFADPHTVLGRSLFDHYFLPEGIGEIAKGGVLRFSLESPSPIATARFLATHGATHHGEKLPVLWGAELQHRIHEHHTAHRAVHVEAFHDFLPNAGTYVSLDPAVTDRWALPVAHIRLEPPGHHRLAGRFLLDRAFEIFADMGADDMTPQAIGGTTSYLVHGTCRAGLDPRTSVLDAWCQVHDISNLFVVDGSFMPTSGGAAPTLTILANSFRVARRIAARFRAGDFG